MVGAGGGMMDGIIFLFFLHTYIVYSLYIFIPINQNNLVWNKIFMAFKIMSSWEWVTSFSKLTLFRTVLIFKGLILPW